MFSSVLWCPPWFLHKNDVWLVFTTICFVGGSCFINVFVYLFTHTGVQHGFHVKWCLCRLSVTRWVSLVEQELLTLPEHLSSPPVFNRVRVARSLVLCVMFCRSLFVICSFSFGHCVVRPSIYGFWLLLCYLQTLLHHARSKSKDGKDK